jgi:hypothetical protein
MAENVFIYAEHPTGPQLKLLTVTGHIDTVRIDKESNYHFLDTVDEITTFSGTITELFFYPKKLSSGTRFWFLREKDRSYCIDRCFRIQYSSHNHNLKVGDRFSFQYYKTLLLENVFENDKIIAMEIENV